MAKLFLCLPIHPGLKQLLMASLVLYQMVGVNSSQLVLQIMPLSAGLLKPSRKHLRKVRAPWNYISMFVFTCLPTIAVLEVVLPFGLVFLLLLPGLFRVQCRIGDSTTMSCMTHHDASAT